MNNDVIKAMNNDVIKAMTNDGIKQWIMTSSNNE